jgi:hypothetical protein
MLYATALFSLALISTGCKKASPLVGKWSTSLNGATVNLNFKDDNTFAAEAKFGPNSMSQTGDYTIDGEKLSMTTKDFVAPNLPPELIAKAKSDPSFGKAQAINVKFVSDDEISLNGLPGGAASANHPITLQRVKAP